MVAPNNSTQPLLRLTLILTRKCEVRVGSNYSFYNDNACARLIKVLVIMTPCDAVGRLSRLINVLVIMTLCDAVGRLFQKGRGGGGPQKMGCVSWTSFCWGFLDP